MLHPGIQGPYSLVPAELSLVCALHTLFPSVLSAWRTPRHPVKPAQSSACPCEPAKSSDGSPRAPVPQALFTDHWVSRLAGWQLPSALIPSLPSTVVGI
jgi:hypothetical protein